MSHLLYPLVAVAASVLGSLIVWLRHRRPRSFTSSIDDFRRELEALAPDGVAPVTDRLQSRRRVGRA